MPGSGVINPTGPGSTPEGEGAGDGKFSKGRTAAGSPTDAQLNNSKHGPNQGRATTPGQSSGAPPNGAQVSSSSSDSGKGGVQSAPGTDAYTKAAAQNDRSQHPGVDGPYGNQTWHQDPDGSWHEGQGFSGALGDANNSLQNQAAANFGKPVTDGNAARDQAIQGAYSQATSRLNPQWQNSNEQLAQQLASQGLDPNSQAYRQAMLAQGQNQNDAYSSAMNGAIAQGTAAGSAVFNQNLQARNAPLSEMQGMNALLPSNQGSQSQSLAAQQAQQNAYMQQQQIYADYAQAGGQAIQGIGNAVGGASDARIKQNLQPLGYDAYPGIPAYEFQYQDAPDQNFNGVLAQDAEKVRPDLVSEDSQGIKRVAPVLAAKPVTWGGKPATPGDGSSGDPYENLSDEQIKKLVHLGVIPEKQEQLEHQQALAEALQQTHNGAGHITGIGAGLGSLGDILNGFAGRAKADEVRTQRAQLQGEQESGRMDYYKRLAQVLGRRNPSAPPLVDAEDGGFAGYPSAGIVPGGDK